MTHAFNIVGIITKPGDPVVAETLNVLAAELSQRQCKVLLDESAAAYAQDPGVPVVDRQSLAERCDIAIVVGGDGTLLNAARSLVEAGVPVLGVNLGRLGFLADVSPKDMRQRLDEILAGRFEEESRALLHASVIRNGKSVSESDALNDVVIHKWDIARMIELDTRIDGLFLNSLRADGLIVSTPTGSTAYALSGGGPIIEPSLPALVLVPICPHALGNRPIVLSDRVTVEILVHGDDSNQAQITCDGQMNFGLTTGDIIQIRRKTRMLRLIHPGGHDHFEVMRKKLHWAEQPVRD
jgi:NAD+ kinase